MWANRRIGSILQAAILENGEKPYNKYRSSRLHRRGKPLKAESGGASQRTAGPGGLPPNQGKSGAGTPEKARKRRGWARLAMLFLLLLLLTVLAVAGISYWRLDRAVKTSNARVPADVRQVLKKPATGISSGPVNILFLGSDQRPDEPARADTILVVRVNGKEKTFSQLSIPRDTLADIPGYGDDKINSAYAYGGPALMIATVEEFTGISIHHYVELDFSGFPAIVDALGGVDINVPSVIDSQYPSGYDWTQVHFDAGPQHMDGERALVFVRVRYSDNDFQRMGRQQQFMEALQKKATSSGSLARMPLIAPEMVSNMTTDMSTNDILRVGWIKFRTPADKNRKFVLIGTSEYIGDGSYVILDENQSQTVIKEFLSG